MHRFILFAAILILILCSNCIQAQDWDQLIKITASDRAVDDLFGSAVSISGDYAIVGATGEDEDAAGNNYIGNAGSAYIFHNNSGTWELVQKIVASDRGAGDQFGQKVSISGDYAIVGVYHEDHDTAGGNFLSDAGSAYIFHNNSGTWEQVQKITASDRGAGDAFGIAVSISGNYAIVSANQEDHNAAGDSAKNNAGSAYIFQNNSGTWTQVQKIAASDRAASDQFGNAVSISGDYAIVGASNKNDGVNTLTGFAYLFHNNLGTWTQVQKIAASDKAYNDGFSGSVSISGDYVIVGAIGEDEDAAGGNTLSSSGSAYIFGNMANLPVELVSFTGHLLKNEVALNWVTATELNNYGFEIQRSGDSESENSWEKIGFVKGHGNSSSVKNYSFIDNKPLAGNVYYGLKQVDNDGSFQYSNIVFISSVPDKYELAQNYPNPFNPLTHISYTLPEKSEVKLIVYDVLGKEIARLVNKEQEIGVYNVEFNGTGLNSGIYFYKLDTGKFLQVKKLMLVK